VQPGSWLTTQTITELTHGLAAKSTGVAAAAGRAVGITAGSVRMQAYALSFIDAFHLVAWTCLAALLLAAMLRRLPMSFRDLRAVTAEIPSRTNDKP